MRIGDVIEVRNRRFAVTRLLGSGGQGDVFEVSDIDHQEALALKWYRSTAATTRRRRQIARLVRVGPPGDGFLWPLGLVDDQRNNRFGYVMPLRPSGFVGLTDVLSNRIERSEAAVLRFCLEFTLSLARLHLKGLCYRDINLGNAFIDPSRGTALVCDNDNVTIQGDEQYEIVGTRRFMAPELVRREATPDKYTDRFSLAVMLFHLLLLHHPLEGRKTEAGLFDDEAEALHYGTEPLFCFDEIDRRNRPDARHHPHVQSYWNALPEPVRNLFMRSFTTGLSHRTRRVVSTEWSAALADALSSYYPCPSCGRRCFLTPGDRHPKCSFCSHEARDLLVLRSGDRSVVVRDGAEVSSHVVMADHDYSRCLATVERHPTGKFLRPSQRFANPDGAQTRESAATGPDRSPGPDHRRCRVRHQFSCAPRRFSCRRYRSVYIFLDRTMPNLHQLSKGGDSTLCRATG